MVSLPLRILVLQDNGGAHPLVMDALAEMSEAQTIFYMLPDSFYSNIHKQHSNFYYLLVPKLFLCNSHICEMVNTFPLEFPFPDYDYILGM